MPTWYHRASWTVLRSLYAPALAKAYNVEFRGLGAMPEPPFLLVADHSNEFDPYVLGSLSPAPLRFMANVEGVHPLKAGLAELVGAYGRRKGANDRAALRRTFELARSGESIGIFPEGDRSWDGASQPIRPGIGKLARRLGMPLVIARQRGNYLSRPRWASTPRKGRWTVDLAVFGADELGRMSDGLVERIVATALSKDEIREAAAEGREFRGRGLARGVGRLLWRCPVCGKADSISGEGDAIACGRCGTRWALDANCRVRPLNASVRLHATEIADLKDWHDWQVATLGELAGDERDGGLRSEGVELSAAEPEGRRRLGRGSLRLRLGRRRVDGAELVFEAGGSWLSFEARSVRGFVDNFNSFSEFDYRGRRWRLEFGGRNAAKWAYALARLCGGAPEGGPEGEAA